MKVLVINSGSSSIKYQLYDMPESIVLAKGLVERIGEPVGSAKQKGPKGDVSFQEAIADHRVGIQKALEMLTQGDHAPLSCLEEIEAVGHRVVHGGERFTDSVLIDQHVVAAIQEHAELAPLHNPPNLLGIEVTREILPKVPQVAVFDTAFHQTLPPQAFMYAIPKSMYDDHRIRRYGFHGTSHRYVTFRASALLEKPISQISLITCHLGNGSSMAAVKNGRSVDTSMGLTPLEGLVMGTRSGDIDPAIIFHLARVCHLPLEDIDKILNKKSGLLGLSEKSNDVRELFKLQQANDPAASLALEIFCYRIKKYVGAYTAILGNLDALVFTAGIGENAPWIRQTVCDGLHGLGIELDQEKNNSAKGKETDISTKGSQVPVWVIPTNEEKMIANDTYQLAKQADS